MKTYKITFKGGHKVSLVKDPAIEETLLKFNAEQEEKLYFANDEKRVVYSVAMIPNKLIFRKDINGEPAQVFYDEQAIEDFQQQYFRKQDLSTNINHAQFNTDGVFPFESWIVANSEVDKSKELGLNAPNGSLVMGFKIENDAIWNDVKEGKLDGLSIEGFTKIEEVTTNTINMNTEKNPQTLWDTLKAFFAVETPPAKTPEEIAAEAAKEGGPLAEENAEPAVDVEDLQMQIDNLTSENEALKAENASLKAEKVKSETSLTTMTTEIEKLKGEIVEVKMVKNVPTEKAMTQEEIRLEKFKKQHKTN
jgi:hypothetical protein